MFPSTAPVSRSDSNRQQRYDGSLEAGIVAPIGTTVVAAVGILTLGSFQTFLSFSQVSVNGLHIIHYTRS